MADLNAFAGRDILFYVGDDNEGAKICARTKTITFGSESIDITQDCDGAFRRLMDEPAVRSMDMAIEGLLTQDDWLLQALDTDSNVFLSEYTMVIPGIGKIKCDFAISNFELGAPYNEAVSFSATVQSSGKWEFTPASSASTTA